MAGRAVRYDVTARAVAPDVAVMRWDCRCCPTLPMVPSQRTSPAIRPDGSAIDPDAFLNAEPDSAEFNFLRLPDDRVAIGPGRWERLASAWPRPASGAPQMPRGPRVATP